MNRKLLGGTAGLLALAGCSSVEQVPLVYVSTTKIGVNVESGSAETPGASIMIGVDLTDAAYVPVAVTRHCSGDTVEMMQLCVKGLAEIQLIKGRSDDFTENDKMRITQLADQAKDLSDKMVNTARTYSLALEARAEASAQLRAAEHASNLVVELEQERSNLADPATFSKDAQLAEARNRASELTQRQSTLQSVDQNLTSARADLDKENGRLKTLMMSFSELIPQRNGNSLGQDDALSVFGTFTGKMGGKTGQETGANVKLGKSFSTGIAAQHLSKGIADREKAIAERRPECIEAIAKAFAALPPGSQTVDAMNKLLSTCEA
jgi:hypothetical protein